MWSSGLDTQIIKSSSLTVHITRSKPSYSNDVVRNIVSLTILLFHTCPWRLHKEDMADGWRPLMNVTFVLILYFRWPAESALTMDSLIMQLTASWCSDHHPPRKVAGLYLNPRISLISFFSFASAFWGKSCDSFYKTGHYVALSSFILTFPSATLRCVPWRTGSHWEPNCRSHTQECLCLFGT
jgi:hypothetical protein